MTRRWVRRRAHTRRSRSGWTTVVRANWASYDLTQKERKRAGGHKYRICPQCGAKIITRRMPNGGWAHFEAAEGLERVLHPCLHRGRGLSRRRDEQTLDLFEDIKPNPTSEKHQ
jgi:hypothetical protein